jgi:hypothetical protein
MQDDLRAISLVNVFHDAWILWMFDGVGELPVGGKLHFVALFKFHRRIITSHKNPPAMETGVAAAPRFVTPARMFEDVEETHMRDNE